MKLVSIAIFALVFVLIGWWLTPSNDALTDIVPHSSFEKQSRSDMLSASAMLPVGQSPQKLQPDIDPAPIITVISQQSDLIKDGNPPHNAQIAELLYSGEIVLTGHLSDAGSDTAPSALETLLWSQVNGNVPKHTEMLRLSFFDNGTRTDRSPHGLTEHRSMLVADAISHAEDVGAVQVIERREFGTTNTLLRVKYFHANGGISTEIVLLKQTSSGWRRDIGWTPTPSYPNPAGRR